MKVSNCCQAEVKVVGNTTKHYECSACHKACDLYHPKQPTELEVLLDDNVLMPKMYSFTEVRELLKEYIDKLRILIAKEIVIAQKEGQPTSRLTSLYLKIDKIK